MLPLSGIGKKICWKMFIEYANLHIGIVRDDKVDDAWASVCSLYGIGEKDGALIMQGIRHVRVAGYATVITGVDILINS